MFTDTITVFNSYEDSLKNLTWYPTVIHGVNLLIDKAAIVAKQGAESKDNAVLNVHYKVENGQIMVGDKPYFPPLEWQRQTNDNLPNSITFNEGNDYDFFVSGEYHTIKPIVDEDYRNGFFEYMKKNYDYVFAITSVSSPYKTIQSFQIMGK